MSELKQGRFSGEIFVLSLDGTDFFLLTFVTIALSNFSIAKEIELFWKKFGCFGMLALHMRQDGLCLAL
ncbi:MAG: hypothetical protein ABSE48_19505 [Verrucomicrobiota bacterium]|jgi:hypothetical protein